jgi:hypothetical protein
LNIDGCRFGFRRRFNRWLNRGLLYWRLLTDGNAADILRDRCAHRLEIAPIVIGIGRAIDKARFDQNCRFGGVV